MTGAMPDVNPTADRTSASGDDDSIRDRLPSPLVYILLALILVLAAFLRWHTITDRGFFFDELWIVELSSGHGSDFFTLPVNQLLDQPNLVALDNARPIWQVPAHITGAIHPPGTFVVLRLWRELFGDSMLALRSCSAFWSMVAVALTFVAARMSFGSVAGLFAALLSAIASANIDQSQDVRGYTLLQAELLATVIVLLRTRGKSSSWLGAAGIGIGTLLLMYTHYFAAGACAAIVAGVLLLLRGKARWQALVAIGIAGVIWCVTWLPQLKAQLAYVHETADLFLLDNAQWPPGATALRLLTSPYRALVADPESVNALTLVGGCVTLYLLGRAARQKFVGVNARVPLLWMLIVVGVIGQLLAMDLIRQTRHLEFMKYSLLANPAICILIGSLAARGRWLTPAAACVALAIAGYLTPLPPKPHYERMVAWIRDRAKPDDLIICSASNPKGYDGQPTYLYVAHGMPWPRHRVAIIVGPQSPEFVKSLPRGVRWFYFSFMAGTPVTEWLPGTKIVETGPAWETAAFEIAPIADLQPANEGASDR